MSVEMLSEVRAKDGKPAYIEFKRDPKYLPKQSEKAGYPIHVEVDYVTVRQIGSNDSVIFEVPTWLAQNRIDVQQGRLHPQFAAMYEESYKRWQSGQEMPLEGTPIKSWPVLRPAQVATLLLVNVRTVEDLATLNDEGLKRVGMGGIDLKQKAQSWMAQAQDKGPLTMEVAGLKKENETLKLTLDTLMQKVEAMQRQPSVATEYTHVGAGLPPADITANDILDPPVIPQSEKRKR